MPSNVNSFGTQISIFAKKTKRDMTDYIQKTYMGIAEEIITSAPCDTGAYIGNWTPSLDVPKTSNDFVPGPSKYKGSRSSLFGNAGNRLRAIAFVRAKLDEIIPLANGTNTFYFSNGVRHARYVEYGGNHTPPYAIVRNAMSKFRRILEQSATFGSGKWSNVGRGF